MNWDRNRGRRLAVTLSVALVACAAPQIASAETVPLPSGAGTGSAFYNTLADMACPSAGNCVATGSYQDSAGNLQGMIETETNGTWTSQELNLAPLPSVSSDPTAQPIALSCASAGNCVAVGTYSDAANHGQGLIATDTDGTWSASQLPLTALPNTYADPGVNLNSVACPSAGNCVAVGSYSDSSQHSEALIATQTNGTWTAGRADLSTLSPYSNPGASLADVTCTSPGNCVAVGSFNDSANQSVSMIETETNGTWSVSRPDLSRLSNVSSTGRDVLWSVSCPSAGNCSAAGYYLDNSGGGGTDRPLVLSQSGGAWGPAAEPQLPGDAGATPAAHLYGLSCASAGDCTAIGDYRTASNYTEALTLTETGGTWAAGTQLTLPSDAAPNPRTFLSSIACTAPGSCVVGGTYYGTGTDNEMLVAQDNAGSWSSAGLVQPTASGAYPINNTTVACAPTGDYCAMGGSSYSWTGNQNEVAFLVNGAGAPTAATATMSGTSAQLSWTAPADNGGLPVTGYTVTAGDLTNAGRGGQTVTAGSTGATLTGLTPGDTYTFTITPTSLLGNGLPVSTANAMVPFSTAQLKAALAGLLVPHGTHSRLKKLAAGHGYTFNWAPLEAGKVTIHWYARTGKGKHRKRRLIGAGSAVAASTALTPVRVRLTALGRRLARTDRRLHRRLHVSATVTFLGATTTVTRTHTFTLH